MTDGSVQYLPLILTTVGCLGWIGLIPFLDRCDQSEQLARFFAHFFNELLISIVGGLSTVLLLLGWWTSTWIRTSSDFPTRNLAKVASATGLVIAAIVCLVYLLPAIRICHF